MKLLGFLAILAACISGIAGGPVQAMPVTLSFTGSILDPSECGVVGVNCNPALYEPSLDGIFASGQAVAGSIVYDPASLVGTNVYPNGNAIYAGTSRGLTFEIASNGGPYVAEFGVPIIGITSVCGVPTCTNSADEQFVALSMVGFSVAPPPVADANLGAGGVTFLNDQNPLSSSALLPAEELISFIQQSRQLLFLVFGGSDACSAEQQCFVLAEISVSVPEPTAASLLGIGLVGMIALRRRRRAAA